MPKHLLLGFSELSQASVLFCFKVIIDTVNSMFLTVLKPYSKIVCYINVSKQIRHFAQVENCNSVKHDNHCWLFATILKAVVIANMSFFFTTSRTIPAEEVVCKHTELKSSLHIQWYVIFQKTHASVAEKLKYFLHVKLFLTMYYVLTF